VTLIAVGAALGVGKLIEPWFGIENVDLVFIAVVVGIAVRYGLWPSLIASVVASLCYNFFFRPPLYTFTITDHQRRRLLFLHRYGGGGIESSRARAHSRRERNGTGTHHRGALCLQPQACRRWHAG
jgi:hypothetical protein